MSFQIAIDPNRRAAARFIGKVRRSLQKVLADNPDITRSQVADAIGVHRSVITKQLNGRSDMSLGRVAEIAWAAGYRPSIKLEKLEATSDGNWEFNPAPARMVGFKVTNATANETAVRQIDEKKLQVEVL